MSKKTTASGILLVLLVPVNMLLLGTDNVSFLEVVTLKALVLNLSGCRSAVSAVS